MNGLAMFLGMSVSIAGIGGLLSGIFAHSLRRSMTWALCFGVLETVLLIALAGATSLILAPILIALFWGLVGWFSIGRLSAKYRA